MFWRFSYSTSQIQTLLEKEVFNKKKTNTLINNQFFLIIMKLLQIGCYFARDNGGRRCFARVQIVQRQTN